MKLWIIYRLDNELARYPVWSATRDAAIEAARLEYFGLVLVRQMLGARR